MDCPIDKTVVRIITIIIAYNKITYENAIIGDTLHDMLQITGPNKGFYVLPIQVMSCVCFQRYLLSLLVVDLAVFEYSHFD